MPLRGLLVRNVGFSLCPLFFELPYDLAYRKAEISYLANAEAEALTGPTAPKGVTEQTLNPPSSEAWPCEAATWGKIITNLVKSNGCQFNWAERSSKHIPFDWSGPA